MTSPESFICVLCKESFSDKETLQTHFRKHGDPTFTKTSQEAEVSKETETKVDLVGCDVCPEVFATISKAITHKHKVHPNHDTKYFCHWCGKLFTMKHLFNKHLTSHSTLISGSSRFHCDCCDVDFYVPSAVTYHNKFFHRQDTDLPVLGHSKKQMFVNKELMQIYYCAFCGEEYINKVNLHKHMKDDHGDENQYPEVVLRCPLCEAVFYHLDAYEIHLTFHTKEDIYNGKEDDVRKDDIAEFTLDTVPPLTETVESVEGEGDLDKGSVNIEDFLQLAMDDNEESNASARKKHKKHKKHKKSKKDAITLDEFLNMNSDVFGEGLDFEGVEEVPDKIVKRLNISKPQKINKNVTKVTATPEIKKLKQLGIAIKMKSVNKPNVASGIKIRNATKPMEKTLKVSKDVTTAGSLIPKNTNQAPAAPTNKEVLSKLLNQNQIVISKKTQNSDSANKEQTSSTTIDVFDKGLTTEELEGRQEQPSSEISSDDKINTNRSEPIALKASAPNNGDTDQNGRKCLDENDSKTIIMEDAENKDSELSDDHVSDHDEETKESPSANILKSISQHISIKSLKQSKPASPVNSISSKHLGNQINKAEGSTVNISENIATNDSEYGNSGKKDPLNMLKNLGHLTIKSSQKSPQAAKNDRETDEEQTVLVKDSKEKFEQMTLHESLQKINPNSIVKSNKAPSDTKDNFLHDADDELNDSDHSDELEDKQQQTSLQNVVQTDLNTPTIPGALKSIGHGITIKQTGPPRLKVNEAHVDSKKEIIIKSKPVTSIKNLNSKVTLKSVHSPSKDRVLPSKEISKDEEIFSVDDSDSDDIDCKAKQPTNAPYTKQTLEGKTTPKSIRPPIPNSYQNVEVKKEANVSDDEEADLNDQNKDYYDAEEEIKPSIISKPEMSDVSKKLLSNKCISIKNMNTNKKPQSNINNPQNTANSPVLDRQMVLYNPSVNSADMNSKTKNANVIKHKNPQNLVRNMSKTQSSPANEVTERQIVKFNPDANLTDSFSDDDGIPDALSNNSSEPCSPPPQNLNSEKLNNDNDVNQSLRDFDFDSDEHQFSDHDGASSSSQMLINKLKNMNQNLSIKPSGDNSKAAFSSSYNQKVAKKNTIQSATDNKRQTIQSKNIFKRESAELTTENDCEDMVDESPTCSKQQKVIERQDPTRQTNKIVQRRQANQQTVNQHVTTSVKTIQSETVVEEITTTVTRTVKTINREVSMSGNQTINRVNVSPNVIRGPNPRANTSLRGVTVRPGRPRIRQAAPSRPVNPGLRAPNQTVPIRPTLNHIRSANPQMPIRTRPSAAPNQPRISRPIKIAKHVQEAFTKANTAPTADDSGHFSCFKKPKESLIPMDSSDEEAMTAPPTFQAQTSNFGNASKTVQSKSVVEMKTEVRSSSHQQTSKLGAVSGLKVMKSSSQVVNKVEKCEVSNNRTLEALERLQKQGLLVKKPRLDEVESYSDDEDGGHSLAIGPP